MKTFLAILLLAAAPALAQERNVPPASQAEVNAGVVSRKYVSPLTLAGWTGAGTNGGGQSNGIVNLNGSGTNTSIRGTGTVSTRSLRVFDVNGVEQMFVDLHGANLKMAPASAMPLAGFDWISAGNGALVYTPAYSISSDILLGSAAGLTNANASALFGTGTVPLARLASITTNQLDLGTIALFTNLPAGGGGGGGSNVYFYAVNGGTVNPAYTFASDTNTGLWLEPGTGGTNALWVRVNSANMARFMDAGGAGNSLQLYGDLEIIFGRLLVVGGTADTMAAFGSDGRLQSSGFPTGGFVLLSTNNNFSSSNRMSGPLYAAGAQFQRSTNSPGLNWATNAAPRSTWSTNGNWLVTQITAANANQRLEVIWSNSHATLSITGSVYASFRDISASNAVVSTIVIPAATVLEGAFETDTASNLTFRVTASANNRALVTIATAALTATGGQYAIFDGSGGVTNGAGGVGVGDALLASNNHFTASNRFGGAINFAGAQFYTTTNTAGFNWATSAPPVATWSTNANWTSTTIVAANANQRLQVIWTNSSAATITNTTPWSFNDRSLSNAVVSQVAIPGLTVIEGEFWTDAATNYSFRVTASANNRALVTIATAALTATGGQSLLSDGSGGYTNGTGGGGSGTVTSVSADTNMSVATATTTPAISLTNVVGTGALVKQTNGNVSGLTLRGTTTNAGTVLFSPDNTYDIGGDGQFRPKDVIAAGTVAAPYVWAATNLNVGNGTLSPTNIIQVDRSKVANPARAFTINTNADAMFFGLLSVNSSTNSQIQFYDTTGTNYVALRPAASMLGSSNYTIVFPPAPSNTLSTVIYTNNGAGNSNVQMVFNPVFYTNATLDFPQISANNSTNLVVNITGVVTNSVVTVSPSIETFTNRVVFVGFVTNAGIVVVQGVNFSASTINPPSGSFNIKVEKIP